MCLPPQRREHHREVQPGLYEIRLRGRAAKKLAAKCDGFTVCVEPVETVLRGPVRDQSALYGILAQIESLGLELVELRKIDDTGAA
jgi:hypothetical protein